MQDVRGPRDIHHRPSWGGHCIHSSLDNANPCLLTIVEFKNHKTTESLLWTRNKSSTSPRSLSKLVSRPPSDHLNSLSIKQTLFWAIFCQTILSMFCANCICNTIPMTKVSTLLQDRILINLNLPLSSMWHVVRIFPRIWTVTSVFLHLGYILESWKVLKKTPVCESQPRTLKSESRGIGSRHKYFLKAPQVFLVCTRDKNYCSCRP